MPFTQADLDAVEAAPIRRGYIYALVDPRGPAVYRYIGQTVRPLSVRRRNHIQAALNGRRGHHGNWIRAILRTGSEPEIIPLESVTVEELDVAERAWISAARAAGVSLTNRTDGGSGMAGFGYSFESRKKMSESAKARCTVEERERRRARMRQLMTPARAKAVSAAGAVGRAEFLSRANPAKDPGVRRKLGAAVKAARLWERPEYRAKVAAARAGRRGIALSAETREKMSAAVRAAWADPVRRAKRLKGQA